jgi:putative DNA-invertase from lambdoid prophage Rac
MARTVIYFRRSFAPNRTDRELSDNLARAIHDRGDILVATYTDDGRITGKGKHAGWRRLLAEAGGIEQIVLADPGDLPGKTIADLLGLLATLTAHGVSLAVPSQNINTNTGPAAILSLVGAYRRTKLSQAIRLGQQRARAAGKHVGRPPIPEPVRRRIVADLTKGTGIRPTAKKFGVAPASVVNIRQVMASILAEAA